MDEVRSAVDGGDIGAIVDAIMDFTSVYTGHWGREARGVTDALDRVPPQDKAAVLMALTDRSSHVGGAEQRRVVNDLLKILVKPFERAGRSDPGAADVALAFAAKHTTSFDAKQLAELTATVLEDGRPITPEVIAVLRRMVAYEHWGHADLLKPVLDKLGGPPLNPGEAWADRVNTYLQAVGSPWTELVAHAATATSAKPSAKWEARARDIIGAFGDRDPGERLRGWLSLVGRPRTIRLNRTEYEPDVNEAFDPVNSTTLRGLVWLAALLPEKPETARVLGGLVETCLRKAAGIGPRNPKIANAAVYALSRIPSEAALAQIARLASRVTYKGTLKELNAALDARAAAMNLSRDEVEELAVPTYGLTDVGVRVEQFGEATATLELSSGKVTWLNSAGKAVKAPPASVRADYAQELKEFKASVKDVDKMLSAQAERLDRQFLAQRTWAHDAWRERYLDHPLLGTLVRRLIWLVGGVPAMFWDGDLRDIDGQPIAPGGAVRLWHPIDREVDEVLAWRALLEDKQITQPFKQAHREVYLLTAAEENTRVYSNRFAAHVLRQHQFHALTAVRGWRNRLRLMVDDTYEPATRDLPQWGLRAEFWIEGIGDDWGSDTSESGAYLRLSTDQVRFYGTGEAENYAHAGGGGYEQWGTEPADPLPLAQIPPLVLSEVLRDVDLFVGVSSVGNDPTWQDGGPEGRFREYWETYSFGELSGTAQTRREMLERLVPRLAIAERATVDGRFLVVRGDIRTYKIHLGSGNILMSPNDQYLCIVAKQASGGPADVFLPFEGDRVLAVILSKALMLAKDTAIADPTITQQIGRKP